jgi:hypothetical protein
MVANMKEVTDIVNIISKYIRRDRVVELARELVDKVGLRTKNESLRVTLNMLAEVANASVKLDFDGRKMVHSIDGKKGLRTYEDEVLGR